MGFLRLVVLCPSLIACATLALTQQHLTDAERDDLAGPVASVSVTQIHEPLKWAQPGGPTLVLPVWCEECEYDQEGNHTRSGQMVNGVFRGQAVRIVYDASGHAIDRFVEDASTGELMRHEVVGPCGITEQTLYQQGTLYWRPPQFLLPFRRRRVMRSSNCQDAHAPKTPHWKLQKDRFSNPDCCR